MTLPTNFKLPELNDAQTPEQITSYLKDLNFEMQQMYDRMTNNINGSVRNSYDLDGSSWIPTVSGVSTAGSFSYTTQVGWVLRQGIMTDVWFDVGWTSIGTAAGYLALTLPYKVIRSDGYPFLGNCYSESLTFGGTALVTQANPGTYELYFTAYQTGFPSVNVSVGANTRVHGHIRYLGEEDE